MIRKRIGIFIFIFLSFFINSLTVDAAYLSTNSGSNWTYYSSLSDALTQAQSSGTASKPAIVKLNGNATGFAKEYNGYITLDLNGYTISNNGTNYNDVQRCLRITGRVFTIKDSSSSKSGKIIGGNTPDQGGMVAYVPGGTLILESGTLTATGSGNNGGIISIGNGTFEMRGGKITGGTIESNQATGVGDGVYWRQGNVTVGETAVIKGNTGGENLYLASGKKIAIDASTPLRSGADIYVSTAVTGTENWNTILGADSVPTIYYKGIEDTDYTISTVKPTNAGLYEATITKGVAKASLKFRIREVYNVSFDENGGRGIMTQVSAPVGEFNVPECTFYAPVNHVFDGWSYSTSGEIISTESISLTRNITLYARWLKHFHYYTDITIREGVTKSFCDCGYYIIRYN